jgi:hypothetical protein
VPLNFERSPLMLIERFKVKRLFPTPTASKPKKKKSTQKHHCPHMLFHKYGCLSALVLVFTGVALEEGNKTKPCHAVWVKQRTLVLGLLLLLLLKYPTHQL